MLKVFYLVKTVCVRFILSRIEYLSVVMPKMYLRIGNMYNNPQVHNRVFPK